MSQTPQNLSARPTLKEGESDVLSDVLETMRLSNLIFGRLELGKPWGLRFEDDLARFYVVARGGTLLEVEGQPSLQLSAGDLALLPKGGAHVLRDAPTSAVQHLVTAECRRHAASQEPQHFGGPDTQTVVVSGAFRFLSGRDTVLLETLPGVIHLRGDDPQSAAWLPSTTQLLISESTSRRPGANVLVSRLADVLLVQALRTQQNKSSCGMRGLEDEHVGVALRLIHGEPGTDWTVESLARASGLSRSGFAARFTELVGEPPLQYLARWRMKKAAQELREQNTAIPLVAEHVGYLSEAAFNKAFKRLEGTTPAAYRRESRKLSVP